MALAVNVAEAQKTRRKKGKGGRRNIIAILIAKYKRAGLDEAQMEKVEAIVKKHSSQIAEIQKAMQLTPEQRKARGEAVAKAKADGLQGRALQQAVGKAINLTEDQKEARQKLRKLQREINQEVMALLTPEQKAKLRKGRGKGGQKERRKKKKSDA